MAQALKIVAVFVVLAALAGALAAAASVVRSLPATTADDPAGISFTETLTIGRYWRHRPGDVRSESSSTGSIHVDVRSAVDKLGLQAGSWDALLTCPSPVGKHETETFQRTNLALSAGATFTVSVATASHRGLHDQTYRCWLRVKIALVEDGTPIVLRDVMLPVRVTHSQHQAG